MTDREVRIDSYFSLPTDLAAEMKGWPEFRSGDGYETCLGADDEEVSTSLEEDEGKTFVLVKGTGAGELFFRVLGAAIYALSAHSDDVWPRVTRWGDTRQPIGSGT
jgi:hypothetical protein